MVTGKLKQLGQRAVKVVDDIADVTLEKVVDFHNDIQGRGGYLVACKNALLSIKDSTRRAYSSIENVFFTDGEFDSEKAKRLLTNNAEAARQYGIKAATVLRDLAADGAIEVKASAKEQFRKFVPTEKERETTYVGIGTAYSGVLFRQHYDGCMAFHQIANQKIPRGLKLKDTILTDIKASASGGVNELKEFYIASLSDVNSNQMETADKFKATLKYLTNPLNFICIGSNKTSKNFNN